MKPTTWFSKAVWLRCIADAVKLDGNVALVVDWKAGKSLNGDPIQLMLTSLMMFAQFPELKCAAFHLVGRHPDHAVSTSTVKSSGPCCCGSSGWRTPLTKRIVRPGRFCRRWCPVKSCEYRGKNCVYRYSVRKLVEARTVDGLIVTATCGHAQRYRDADQARWRIRAKFIPGVTSSICAYSRKRL